VRGRSPFPVKDTNGTQETIHIRMLRS
jgi:hypothetical protein